MYVVSPPQVHTVREGEWTTARNIGDISRGWVWEGDARAECEAERKSLVNMSKTLNFR